MVKEGENVQLNAKPCEKAQLRGKVKLKTKEIPQVIKKKNRLLGKNFFTPLKHCKK